MSSSSGIEGLATNPVACLAAHSLLTSCMTAWPSSSLAAYDAVAQGTRSEGIAFLPTRGFVCYERQRPAVVGHTIVWMDTNHLTGIYSAQLSTPFRSEFRLLVR